MDKDIVYTPGAKDNDSKMISLREAAKLRLARIRRPKWSHKMDHIEIRYNTPLTDSGIPLFGWFYGPFNKECNGRDKLEVCLLSSPIIPGIDDKEWVEYTGALPDSEEYISEQALYEGCLSA